MSVVARQSSGGSIEQRGPNTWRLTLSAGVDAAGKRRVIRRTIKGDRKDAERELIKLNLEVGEGIPAEFTLSTTVEMLLDAWLPVADLAPKTRYDYRLAIRKHIVPGIGGRLIHQLKPYELDRFYRALADGGLGPDRIRRCHSIISKAFEQAVKWEWVQRNPALNASQPSAPERDPESPEPGEVRALSAGAHDTSLRTAVAIHLAAHLGSRLGEVCGLKWSDFKLDAVPPTVTIVRTVDVVPHIGEVVKDTKGRGRKRRAPKPLDADTVALMRLWDMATAEDRADGLNPDGWVFQAPLKRSFYRPRVMSRDFRAVANAAGLPEVHMHSLRHYMVAQLRAAGVDLDAISSRVGHTRNSTTIDLYGGPVAASAVHAAEVIARITRGDD